MDPFHIEYTDFYDEVCYSLNLNRFKKLSENHKEILMRSLINVLCRHSENLPLMKTSADLMNVDVSPIYCARTFTKFCKSLQEFHGRSRRVTAPEPFKIELGCLPTADFIFSQKPVNLPDFYKCESVPNLQPLDNQEGLPVQQYPVNVFLGNVNIFKYINAIRYLGQPSSVSSSLSPQIPVHSYITYLWGAAIDQYYQVALQNNLL